MDLVTAAAPARSWPAALSRLARAEILLAVLAFLGLCAAALSVAPRLVEPDDYAYQASIVGITQGHLLTLSTAQAGELARHLGQLFGPRDQAAPVQWVQLADGRWISEKDPGYPFLAVVFQELGLIRLAPLFFGALACLGLFAGGRRWLGRYGGTAAVVLFCSSGAAMLFAWRDYMPTFTDAALIAAGTGTLLWAVLADEASPARRTWAGLAAFVALEAAAFTRYTDIVVLGCAALAVLAAWGPGVGRLPRSAVAWWLGSAAVFGAFTAVFDSLVYGGPLTSGYRPGEIQFSLSALGTNLRYMPVRLIETMPLLLLGLAAAAWIVIRSVAIRRGDARPPARRDLAVAAALLAAWLGLWGLYAAYTWTAGPGVSNLQAVRFYLPALGAVALLGAWLVTRLPRRAWLAGAVSAGVAGVLFALGGWSYASMTGAPFGGLTHL
ncbi:MAG: hypothetical protein ACRDRJ_51890, partial [Streptosporangiaceae bacterium]